ncbi:MAG: hypothetical protein GY928_34255 [Colwellia sp.]|nr:hypothetical protein [Colwellia sp.]
MIKDKTFNRFLLTPKKTSPKTAIQATQRRIVDSLGNIANAPKPPEDYQGWLTTLIPSHFNRSFAPHMHKFWQWVWTLKEKKGQHIPPHFMIVHRDGGKTTMAEAFCAYLIANRFCRYIVYVRKNQDLADQSIGNIKKVIESPEFKKYFPQASKPARDGQGNQVSWQKKMLAITNGTFVEGVGLGSSFRGTKKGKYRPDVIIIDDISNTHDSVKLSKKNIDIILGGIIGARAEDVIIFGIQNLVNPHDMFSQICDKEKMTSYYGEPYFTNKVVWKYKAINGFKWEKVETPDKIKINITAGEANWVDGLSIERCQQIIDDMGITHFLTEYQHDQLAAGGKILNRKWFKVVDNMPFYTNVRHVRYWDTASTEGGGSFTVGVLMAKVIMGPGYDNCKYYILDVIKGQWNDINRETQIQMAAESDGQNVHVYVEREPGGSGVTAVNATIDRLTGMGFYCSGDHVTGSKENRASPLGKSAGTVKNVYVVKRSWTEAYLDALHSFPDKTDETDATSGAFNMLAGGGVQVVGWTS